MLRQGWYVMKGGTLQHAVCITKEETGSRGMMITDGGGWQRADEAHQFLGHHSHHLHPSKPRREMGSGELGAMRRHHDGRGANPTAQSRGELT